MTAIEISMTEASCADTPETHAGVPEGFVAFRKRGGYMANFGELYVHEERRTLAVRIDESHLNPPHYTQLLAAGAPQKVVYGQ
ncbi:hypothetical protein [Cupriavidus necator]